MRESTYLGRSVKTLGARSLSPRLPTHTCRTSPEKDASRTWEKLLGVLPGLLQSQQPPDNLWTFSPAQMVAEFQTSLEQFGVSHLGWVRYSLRHAGASNDLLSQRRTLEGIKMRGRWSTDASLKRYTKPAKALKGAHQVPTQTSVRDQLPSLFRGTALQ